MFVSNTIKLLTVEQEELARQASSQSGRADEARRARLLQPLDAGHAWASIREKLDCADSFIDRWGKRLAAERLAGPFREAPHKSSDLADSELADRRKMRRCGDEQAMAWARKGKAPRRGLSKSICDAIAGLREARRRSPRGRERVAFGDQAYWKEADRQAYAARGVRCRINRRLHQGAPSSERWRLINRPGARRASVPRGQAAMGLR